MDRRNHCFGHGRRTARFEAMVKATFFLHAKLLFVMTAILFEPHFANGQEDVASIIQRSSEANEGDWAAVPCKNDAE